MEAQGMRIFELVQNVQLFHTDATGLATMTALCRFAQESAGYHAAHLGFGLGHLAEQKIAWVLREQAMKVFRFPALGEKLRILTWPTRAERILCHRDYRILDQQGHVVALGTSAWFGLDLENRRPRKADSFFNLQWELFPGPAFEQPLPNLEVPAGSCPTETRTVRASDEDALGHMNNLRYLDWIADHLAHFGVARHSAYCVRIRHVREVTVGDVVRIRHAVDATGDILLHMLGDDHGKEVCLARVVLAD